MKPSQSTVIERLHQALNERDRLGHVFCDRSFESVISE
jgi:hypothetical protein